MPTATEALSQPAPPAPSSSPAPAPSQSQPTAQPAPSGLPQAAPPSGWWDSVKDPAIKEWAANKKFPDAESALKSYSNLEQLMGADKAGRTVMTPKDDTDVEGWKALGTKLGVPANAEEYKLPVPEGDNGDFAKLASGWMQKANIPPAMARALAAEWNTHAAAIESQAKGK